MTDEEDQTGTQDDQNGHESDEQGSDGQEDQSGTENGSEGQENDSEDQEGQEQEGDTFPRAYVQELRKENQGYRDRAKKGELALSRLAEVTVRDATKGILFDPSDLSYDEKTMSDDDGFPDSEKIKEAAQELVSKKPHLAPRRPRGDIGQGTRSKDDDFSLAGILRSNAG